MKSRELLSEKLHSVCDNVYFNPDSNIKMKYPCIVYTFESPQTMKADDKRYVMFNRYSITNIYRMGKNSLYNELMDLFPKYFTYDNNAISDGLNNDYYTLYW